LRSSSARYSTALQALHLVHKPSGTEPFFSLFSVRILEGINFSNQFIFF